MAHVRGGEVQKFYFPVKVDGNPFTVHVTPCGGLIYWGLTRQIEPWEENGQESSFSAQFLQSQNSNQTGQTGYAELMRNKYQNSNYCRNSKILTFKIFKSFFELFQIFFKINQKSVEEPFRCFNAKIFAENLFLQSENFYYQK